MKWLIPGDSLEKSVQWSSMINNLVLKGITNVDLVSGFSAKLEFGVDSNSNKSLLQMHECMLTQN